MTESMIQLSEEWIMPADESRWHTFEEILLRLHQEGIWLHPTQLAEFFVKHGLPVDLQYVSPELLPRATQINDNYAGNMARLEEAKEPLWYSQQFY